MPDEKEDHREGEPPTRLREVEDSLRRTRDFLRNLDYADEPSRRYIEEIEHSLCGKLERLGKRASFCSYEVDARDRIVTCDAGWNRAAAEYRAPENSSHRVVGRELWEFISDPATEELHRRAVAAARDGATVSLAFRCDLPAERRAFDLEIRPSELYGAGCVRFTLRLAAAVPRPEVHFPRPRPEADGPPLRACSWCSRFHIPAGDWVELEDAIPRLETFSRVLPTICPGCRTAASSSIADSHDA